MFGSGAKERIRKIFTNLAILVDLNQLWSQVLMRGWFFAMKLVGLEGLLSVEWPLYI